MKAVRIVPGPEGGRLGIHEVPVPRPEAGQVLVRVAASGLNRGEINQVRRARTGDPAPAGVEFAGMVEGIGDGVTGWQQGDAVMGHGNGGQAEYVLAAARALMPVPPGMPWLDAAALPNVFVTAHDALVTNGEFKSGDTVLVNAASSGIGLAAIQIASQLGAGQIYASSRSPEKVRKLCEYGVTHAIDLSLQDQVDAVMSGTAGRGVDVIVDSVGGTVFEANLKSLAVKGRLVNIGRLGSSSATIDLEALWMKRLKLIGVTFRTRTEEERLACIEACARDLLPLLRAGRIRFPIDRSFRMDEIAAAHDYMQADRHFGKIVIAIDPALPAPR